MTRLPPCWMLAPAWAVVTANVVANVVLLSSSLVTASDKIDYARDIKPLLKNCYVCHGPLRQQGGLRVDTAALLKAGGDSGAAVVPGQADESLMVHAVTGTNGVSRMPPEEEGAAWSAEAIHKFKLWIDQGAESDLEAEPVSPRHHWSFQRPVRPKLPPAQEPGWVRNPIDAFVLSEHHSRGLTHAPEAAKNILLRRVYLDLIGLPPTPTELRAFLADDSPHAYEKVVQRLLDSPHYGERWGRHWMDVWRYSDWAGYRDEIRESQFHIWRWRDWIVESLNADKPYDQMILEMVAADELAPADPSALRATGYLGRNWFKFNRHVWLDNTVEHCGKAFLGLTFNCARCHDHKYDPISQTEYYRLRAIFEPYDVRYDRVPGQMDATKDGIARVFDKRLEDPTFLLVRGNEQTPDKDHPLKPGLPEFFAADYVATAVSLPVASYYPALADFQVDEVRAQLLAVVTAAEALVAQSKSALAATPTASAVAVAGAQPSAAADPDTAATNPVTLAACKLAASQATLTSFERRLVAERAKFGLQPYGDVPALAKAASRAERQAAVANAALLSAEAEQRLAAAKASAHSLEKAAAEKARKAVDDAAKRLAAANEALATAQKSLASESEQYTPLGDIHPASSTGRRSALARWLTSRDNPLTARVAINHLWLRHFGRPIVPTVFDFGMNGQLPSHPQLLDWLATELMENGWRMKPIHYRLVTSATYRQASSPSDFSTPPHPQQAIDPDNRYLWRMNVRRLEAEIVRDSLLSVAGSLNAQRGGPEIDQNQGQANNRRSIYFRHAKEKEMVFTKLFDGPGVSECYQREESIAPQQALAMANSPLGKNQSRILARQLSQPFGPEQGDLFIIAAFEHVLARVPSDAELPACREFLTTQSQLFSQSKPLTASTVGEAGTVKAASDPSQRARENLVHVLLNHHDFVTVR